MSRITIDTESLADARAILAVLDEAEKDELEFVFNTRLDESSENGPSFPNFLFDQLNTDGERAYVDVPGYGTVVIVRGDEGLSILVYPFKVVDEPVVETYATLAELQEGKTTWGEDPFREARDAEVLKRYDESQFSYVELDPEVNFFILTLERLGCTTHFSCAGHPKGF